MVHAWLEGTCYQLSDKQYRELTDKGIIPILCSYNHDAIPFIELKKDRKKRQRRHKLVLHVPIFIVAIIVTVIMAVMGTSLFAVLSTSAISVGTLLSAVYTALGVLKDE